MEKCDIASTHDQPDGKGNSEHRSELEARAVLVFLCVCLDPTLAAQMWKCQTKRYKSVTFSFIVLKIHSMEDL